RTAMSTSRLAKFSSATIAPSTAMMKIWSWKRGTYLRMPRRSVGLIVAVVAEGGVGALAEPLLMEVSVCQGSGPSRQRCAAAAGVGRKSFAHDQLPALGVAQSDQRDAVPTGRKHAGGQGETHRHLGRADEQRTGDMLEVGYDDQLARPHIGLAIEQVFFFVRQRGGKVDGVGRVLAGLAGGGDLGNGGGEEGRRHHRGLQGRGQAARNFVYAGGHRRPQRFGRSRRRQRYPPVARGPQAQDRGPLARLGIGLIDGVWPPEMQREIGVDRNENNDGGDDPLHRPWLGRGSLRHVCAQSSGRPPGRANKIAPAGASCSVAAFMKFWSQYFIPTLKESPADAEIPSHKLLIRAGLVRKLGAGHYTYLPLGLRALQKITQICREEMEHAGAIELWMPHVHPAEFWQEGPRWAAAREIMFRTDSASASRRTPGEPEFVLGPTHEEIITPLVKNEITSYRDLPKNFFQIATKFRNEIRPRYGLMRAREFVMMDAYSFDVDDEAAIKSYQAMKNAYESFFRRIG